MAKIYDYLVFPANAATGTFKWQGEDYTVGEDAFNNFFGLDGSSKGRGFAGDYEAVSVVINNSGTWDITNEEFVVDPQPEASSYGTTSVTLGKFFNNGTINLVCTPDDDDDVESISFDAPKFNNAGTFTVSGKCTVSGVFAGNGTVIFKGGEITTDLDDSTNNLKTSGEVASTITGTLTGASFDNTTKAPTLSYITLTLGSEADPGSFKGAAFLECDNTIVAKLDPYNDGTKDKDSIIYVRADNVGLSESTITGGTIFLGKSSTFPVSELNVYGENDFDGTVLFLGYKNTTLNIEDAVVTGGTIYNTQTLNGVVNIVNAELGEADDEDDDTEEKKVLIENKGFTGPSNTGSFSVSGSVIYASTIKNSGTINVEDSTIFAEEIIDNKRSANNTSVFSLTDSNLTAGELTIEATKADFTFAGGGTLTIGTLTGTITALDGAVLASSSVGGGTLKIKADSDVVFYGTNSFGIIDNAGTITVNSLDDVSPASLTATSINGEIVLADNVIGTNPEKKTYMVVSGLETETVSKNVANYDLVLFNKAAYLTSVDAGAATVHVNSDYTGENGSITNEGYIVGYNAFSTLADAAKAAKNGTVISVGGDDILSAASAFVCGGNVTITGTAKFNWGEDWMYVGRADEGDVANETTTVIFDSATISRAGESDYDRSINISGAKEGDSLVKNGAVVLDHNSSVGTEYIMNRNALTVKTGSTLNVTTYLGVAGRGENSATLNVNAATVNVEGDAEPEVTAVEIGKGVVTLENGAVFNVATGTVENAGTINIVGLKDSEGDKTYFKANKLVNTGSVTVSGLRVNLDIKNLDGEIVVVAQKIIGDPEVEVLTTLRGNTFIGGKGTVKIATSENASKNTVYIYDVAEIQAAIENEGILSVGSESIVGAALTAGTITNGSKDKAGAFTVAVDSSLIDATVNNNDGSTFTVNGTLNGVTVNNGTITSTTGFAFVGSSALNGVTVSANGKTITNTGTLTVTGTLAAEGATITNTGATITVNALGSITAGTIKGGTIELDASKFTGTFGSSYTIVGAALTGITSLTIVTADAKSQTGTKSETYANGADFEFNGTHYTVMINSGAGIALSKKQGDLTTLLVNAGWDLPVGTQVSLGGIDGTIGYNAFKNLSFLSTSTSPEDYLEASKVVFAKGTEYTLSAYTYFYADNESGKTTLTTAVPTPPNASDAVKIDGNRFYLMGKVKPAGEATTINAENYFASAMTSPAHKFEFADGTKFVMQQLLVGWGPDSDDINDDGSIQRQVGKAAVTVSGDLSTNLLNLYQFSSVDVKDGGTLDVTKGTKDASSVNSIVFAPGSSLTVTASAMPAEGKPQFKANRLFFNDGGSATFTGTRVSFAALTPSSKGAVSFVPEDFDRTCTVTLDGSILDAIADAEGDDSFFKTDGDYGYAKAMVVTIKNGSTVNAQNKTFNVLDKVTVNVGLETGDTGNNKVTTNKLTSAGEINVYNGSTLIAGSYSTNDGTINVIGTADKKSTLTITAAFTNDVQPSGDNNKGTGRLYVKNGVINSGSGTSHWLQNTWEGVITLINADVNVQLTNRATVMAENTTFSANTADKRITADAGSITLVTTKTSGTAGKSSITAEGGIVVNASGVLRINNAYDIISEDEGIAINDQKTDDKYATQITGSITNNAAVVNEVVKKGTFQAAYADINTESITNAGSFELVNASVGGSSVSVFENTGTVTLDSVALNLGVVETAADPTADTYFKVKGASTLNIGTLNNNQVVGGLSGTINVEDGAALTAAIYAMNEDAQVLFDAKAGEGEDNGITLTDGAKIMADIVNSNAKLKVSKNANTLGNLTAGDIANSGKISAALINSTGIENVGTLEVAEIKAVTGTIKNSKDGAKIGSITATSIEAGTITNNADASITATSIKADTITNNGSILAGVTYDANKKIDGAIGDITATGNITNGGTLVARDVTGVTVSNSGDFKAFRDVTANRIETSAGTFVVLGEADVTGNIVVLGGEADFSGEVSAALIIASDGTINANSATLVDQTIDIRKGTVNVYGDSDLTVTLQNNSGNVGGSFKLIGVDLEDASVTALNNYMGAITVQGESQFSGFNSFSRLTNTGNLTINAVDPTLTSACLTVTGDFTNTGKITINAKDLDPITTAGTQIISVTGDVNVSISDLVIKDAKAAVDGYTVKAIVRTESEAGKGIYLCAVASDVDTTEIFANTNWDDTMTDSFPYGGKDIVIGVNGFVNANSITLGEDTETLKFAGTGASYGDLVMKQSTDEKIKKVELVAVNSNTGYADASKIAKFDNVTIADSNNAIINGIIDVATSTTIKDSTVTFKLNPTDLGALSATNSIINADGKMITTTSTVLNGSTLNLTDTVDSNLGAVSKGAETGAAAGTINTDWGSRLSFTSFDGTLDVDITGYSGNSTATTGDVVGKTVVTGDAGIAFKGMFEVADKFNKYFIQDGNNLVMRGNAYNVYKVNSAEKLETALTHTWRWTNSASEVVDSHVDSILVTSGSYAGTIDPKDPASAKKTGLSFNGITTIIDGGSFTAGRVCGGFITVGADWRTSVDTKGDYSLTINTSTTTFSGVLVGGDRALKGCGYHDGDISLTINDGNFATVIAGMMYDQEKTQTKPSYSLQEGDVNLTIKGGTFTGYVYGGSGARVKAQGARTQIEGDITVTVDASENAIDLQSGLVVGSMENGEVTGNTTLVVTGDGDNLKSKKFWGGSSGDTYEVNAAGQKIGKSYVSGKRTLSFVGFTGDLNVDSIKMFTDISFDKDSDVNFENFKGTLAEVEKWTIAYGSENTGAFNNDFTGDTLNLTGLDEMGIDEKWTIFDNVSLFADEGKGKIAFASISFDDDVADYALSIEENAMILTKSAKPTTDFLNTIA